ncbi:MAG: hypothetical protein JXB49_03755 [Bacteroidales bacterium]|nr:hypothetical protein [Bacteroidales bacterium]
MPKSLSNKKANFGTMPVFMTAISTILGAILFLRFGYAVANVGFIGVVGIIIIGHMVTVPTALAVAEIATNQKVLGGGAYYIISRSFGFKIGGAIGIALYLSQAISVAFYIIAFGESVPPLLQYFQIQYDLPVINSQYVSIGAMAILSVIVLIRGANMGMKALYVVVAILFTSLAMFFAGKPTDTPESFLLNARIDNPDSFFYVFTIVFPAFTGLAAGLGLSGDLRDPSKSIPRGTIWATVAGFFVYLGVTLKLTYSATPEQLGADFLYMQKIATWGPIIPIGLAAASLSSAIGSILIAPRTLQAIGKDNILPGNFFNRWIAKGKPVSDEPVNASLISIIIAFSFIFMGDIDSVAKIISMFFMLTYGAICLISFFEHFAADPSYRPKFRSRWIISFIGAVGSFWLMFKMNTPYAIISLIIMGLIYYMISFYSEDKKGLEKLFKGVIFQLTRQLQVIAQRANKEDSEQYWRPFVVCISPDTFKRISAFDLLRWISYKYGFGTYIHYIEGYLSSETNEKSKGALASLLNLAAGQQNRVYVDTMISPSYTSAIAQVIQLTSISGKSNNMILFEFSRTEPEALDTALKNYSLLVATGFDVCILNTSYKGFGYHREIHIWITSYDYENANLMILMAYIILGHPEWSKGLIKIFAIYDEKELHDKRDNLIQLIHSGRLPISTNNVTLIASNSNSDPKELISEKSKEADLAIVGFRKELVKIKGMDLFTGYKDVGNILFISSNKEKEIK